MFIFQTFCSKHFFEILKDAHRRIVSEKKLVLFIDCVCVFSHILSDKGCKWANVAEHIHGVAISQRLP